MENFNVLPDVEDSRTTESIAKEFETKAVDCDYFPIEILIKLQSVNRLLGIHGQVLVKCDVNLLNLRSESFLLRSPTDSIYVSFSVAM